MQRPSYRSWIVCVFLGLSACGLSRPSAPQPLPLPSPGGPWTITLTQSGGFAGVLRTIEVSSDGHLSANDQRSGRSATTELSLAQMAELNRLLAQTAVSAITPTAAGCADCFIYDLALSARGGTFEVHANDVSLPDSGAHALINYLNKLRDDALAAAP
jgi:hypothetical protein